MEYKYITLLLSELKVYVERYYCSSKEAGVQVHRPAMHLEPRAVTSA